MSDGAGLALAAAIYRSAVTFRNTLYDRGLLPIVDPGLPAISIGNLTAGGTGKTPLVLHLARVILASGLPVGLLSRGYGRRTRTPVIVLPGAELPGPDLIGDEPWLLRTRLPRLALAIDARRARGARLVAPHLAGGCFLLDDGFQHRGVRRTLDVVVVAPGEPFGKGRLLPHGRLREPQSAIRRASHIVIIDSPPPGAPTDQIVALWRELSLLAPGMPIARARPVLSGFRPLGEWGAPLLAGTSLPAPVLAVAGIGRPERFLTTLAAAGVRVAAHAFFRDHHRFTAADGTAIAAAAATAGATAIVTTEKDEPRLLAAGGSDFLAGRPAFVAVMELVFAEGEDGLRRAVAGALGRGLPRELFP